MPCTCTVVFEAVPTVHALESFARADTAHRTHAHSHTQRVPRSPHFRMVGVARLVRFFTAVRDYGRSLPASVGVPAPARRPLTLSAAATISPPPTRRAASTARLTRLMLSSYLLHVAAWVAVK